MAKSGLSTAEIGVYEMLIYIGSTLSFFWVIGLLDALGPFYGKLKQEQGEIASKTLLFKVFILFAVLAVLLSGVILFFHREIGQYWVQKSELPYIGWLALYLALNLPTYPVEYVYLVNNRAKSLMTWAVLSFCLHLLAVGIPLWAGWGIEGSLKMLTITAALKLLWTIGVAYQYALPHWDGNLLKRYLRFAAPLILIPLVGNAMLLWDMWLVRRLNPDPAAFAVFRYGARELPLAMALCTALGASMSPLIATNPASGMADLKHRSWRLTLLLFLVSAVLFFVSTPLFSFFFNADFKASAAIFNIYLLITASRVLLPGSVLLGLGDSKSSFRIALIEFVARIVLTWFLGAIWGLEGIALGVVLSFWVEKLGQIYVLKVKHQVQLVQWLNVPAYLAALLLLFSSFAVSRMVFN